VKKSLFKAVLVRQYVFPVFFLALPVLAYGAWYSFISDFLWNTVSAESQTLVNSQTMPLLQSVANPEGLTLARGGGDIAIVNDSALLPETGPSGSMVDVADAASRLGHISVYVVHKGDTLSQIAKMFGVTTNTIAWGNDIRGGLIHEGQTLVILPVSGVQHTVKKGDTLASIAKLYEADAEEIAQYNDLSDGETLTVGAVVIVPDGEIAAAPVTVSTSRLRGASGPEYSGYYMRPIVGGRKTQGLHGYNGVDLAAYRGAPIFASASGLVIIARSGGWNGGYGNYVVISHNNGTQTLYAHLSSLTVSAGVQVAQGEVIGYEGSTGKATGPHLHFEIRGAKNPF